MVIKQQLHYLLSFFFVAALFMQLNAQNTIDILNSNEEKAEKYLRDGNKAEAARLYNKNAYEYRRVGNTQKSIESYKKVLSINAELGNNVGQMLTHTNLSMLYIEAGEYESALGHLEEELKFRQKSKNPLEIIPVIISIAGVKNELGRYEDAVETATHAIEMSQEINDLSLVKRAYGKMYEIYSNWGKQSKAQSYFEMYSAVDKRLKEMKMAEVETKAKAKINEANLEKAKTEKELTVKSKELEETVVDLEEAEEVARQQQMELELQQAQINEQNALLRVEKLKKTYFAIAFGITLVFMLVLAFLVIRIRNANRKIEEQKKRLEKQNREIHSSIRYAKTIQTAMLPALESIEKIASHFTIYRPKDIVSGDFYWAAEMSENRVFFAVVDCTGHGVPGAFMSMIGMRMLNEIVNEMKIDSPAAILESLNELLREALRQEQTDNNDGMDLAICRLDKGSEGRVEVTFSGAKRPLYVGRRSKQDLEIYNPDRKSIGGYQPTKRYIEFTNQKVVLDPGDVIYLFSDGIVDQNDPHRKKFGRARLENILKSCIDKDAEGQRVLIEQKLDQFIQNEQQRDDITFSGLIIK